MSHSTSVSQRTPVSSDWSRPGLGAGGGRGGRGERVTGGEGGDLDSQFLQGVEARLQSVVSDITVPVSWTREAVEGGGG